MRRRIFVALPISEELQNEILKWEKKFSNLPVRWLAGKNLHITLVSPWYEEDLERIKSLLRQVENFGAISLAFENVAFGPEPQRPRLIWAEGETPKKLLELHKKVHEILGREKEKRPFRLHLTIARFRPKTFSSFPVKQLDEKVDWRDKIDRLVLFESRLAPGGADYTIIAEASL